MKNGSECLGFGWADAIRCHLVVFWLLGLMGIGWGQEEDTAPEVEAPEVLPGNVEKFFVKTRSAENKEVPFYLRTPVGWVAEEGRTHRMVFLCPYMSQSGLVKMQQNPWLLDLADERGWFVMSATFNLDLNTVRDRKTSYYYPESFSGKAVVRALGIAAKKYPVDVERIFMEGNSGGAQFTHRFAMVAPERVDAAVVNSCSWFDEPEESAAQVAWLILVGESDPSHEASLEVVDRLREAGAAPLFRSYIGQGHGVTGGEVDRLVREFLICCDDRTKGSLGKKRSRLDAPAESLAMKAEEMPFVGDGQIWTYRENTPENVADLPEDSRVFLPSKAVAEIWGTYDKGEGE